MAGICALRSVAIISPKRRTVPAQSGALVLFSAGRHPRRRGLKKPVATFFMTAGFGCARPHPGAAAATRSTPRDCGIARISRLEGSRREELTTACREGSHPVTCRRFEKVDHQSGLVTISPPSGADRWPTERSGKGTKRSVRFRSDRYSAVSAVTAASTAVRAL
jgi:hypothetical protein